MVSMKLKALLAELPVEEFRGDAEVEITSVEYDSRRVSPGTLFIALRGSKADGHDYIQEAVARGAIVVLAEEPGGGRSGRPFILGEEHSGSFCRPSAGFFTMIPPPVCNCWGW